MDVVVVRHAVAEERDPSRWPDDSERPLTAKGKKDFARAARGLVRLVPAVDFLISSPFVRAWQTAELLRKEARWAAPVASDSLAADNAAESVIDELARYQADQRIALVGHEPDLSSLVSLLCTGAVHQGRFSIKKGGVALVSLDRVAVGSGTLVWLATPGMLRRLAR
jgi:phosphohistidine phosphatase